MKSEADKNLLRLAKAGNRYAAGKLLQKYQEKILALAFDYTGNYEEARDIAQDVFVKALDSIGGFEEKSAFSTWLYRITINRCLDRLRMHERKKRLLERERLHNAERKEIPAEPLLIDLNRADLSEAQRTAVILRYFNDLSVSEIAEILDCSEKTVRTHLYRAIKKLRAQNG
jgi:RNA polymerase sigma-70 factor (ECF subfamily)